MNKKVWITISKGNYDESVKNGTEFTSVGFQASTYGSGSPCDTPEDVQSAIQHCKEWIREKGDIPIVDNQIEKRTLGEWF